MPWICALDMLMRIEGNTPFADCYVLTSTPSIKQGGYMLHLSQYTVLVGLSNGVLVLLISQRPSQQCPYICI